MDVLALAATRRPHELSPMMSPRNALRDSNGPSEVADAVAGGPGKRDYVRTVFEQIAPSYDLLNHLLSLNIDGHWRRKTIAALGWERDPTGTYLDLCAGTMDVGSALARAEGFSGRVVAADFAEPMLRAGRGKAPREIVWPVVADALRLPIGDACLAGAVVAFGARNLADLDQGLRELRRVIRPGGRFAVLEFTTPRGPIARAGYHAYFHHLLPVIGGMISGHRTAYEYLPRSVAAFLPEEEFVRRMQEAGFSDVHYESLTFGIAAIHVGTC